MSRVPTVPAEVRYPNFPADLLGVITSSLRLELASQSSYPPPSIRSSFMVFRDHLARYCNASPGDALVLWIGLPEHHELRSLCDQIALCEQIRASATPMHANSITHGHKADTLRDRRRSSTFAVPAAPRLKCIPLPPEDPSCQHCAPKHNSHRPHTHHHTVLVTEVPSTSCVGLYDAFAMLEIA